MVAEAATTINSNINTGGTLSVTGVSTLTGAVTVGNNITVPAAYGFDTAGAGALNIGTSTATSIEIADTGVLTTIQGTLNVDEAVTFDTTLGVTGATTFSSNFTLDNSAASTVTMTNGLNFDTNTLVIDPNSDRVGIGTAVPNTAFEVVGTASSTNLIIGGGTSISKHLSETTSLDFPIIAANSCESLTITVTGAADGDTVSLGMPNSIISASSTLAVSGWVSAADTVTVRVCQVASSGTSDFAAATVRTDVWKH